MADHPPVFIIGCHRSGTTLLRYVLDAHPHIACPPETKFIGALVHALAYPQAVAGWAGIGLAPRVVLRDMGRMIDGWLSDYAHACGKRRWVDKTPNYSLILPSVDAMFSARARYLWITRHPLDTATSLRDYFSAPIQDDPDIVDTIARRGRSFLAWTSYWNDVNLRIRTFVGAAADRCYRFTYEDFVTAPDVVLTRILRFIDAPAIAHLDVTAFSTPHAAGYGDAVIRSSTAIYRTRVGISAHIPKAVRRRAWLSVRDLAASLGYSEHAQSAHSDA
jgi:hypothetical protein